MMPVQAQGSLAWVEEPVSWYNKSSRARFRLRSDGQ